MSFQISWTPEAQLTLNQNLDYLTVEWDNKVINQFLDKLEDALQKIKQHPRSYPQYNSLKEIRKYTLNKRIVLYYRILDNYTIELLVFWNVYRDPKNLKF